MYVDNRWSAARFRAFKARRREPRYISTVPVAFQRFLRFGPFTTRGVSLDISALGMSALVCGHPRVGETVVIELPLAGTPIEMLATVRHSNPAKSGFEFYPLSPTAERGLQSWIREMREHEEMLFPERLQRSSHLT